MYEALPLPHLSTLLSCNASIASSFFLFAAGVAAPLPASSLVLEGLSVPTSTQDCSLNCSSNSSAWPLPDLRSLTAHWFASTSSIPPVEFYQHNPKINGTNAPLVQARPPSVVNVGLGVGNMGLGMGPGWMQDVAQVSGCGCATSGCTHGWCRLLLQGAQG